MTGPFDWKYTARGKKEDAAGNVPKDDSIASFRNISQASPGRDLRLPPGLRPEHFDEFPSDPKDPAKRGPGMMAVQRRLVGGGAPVSTEVASQVPIHDPMVSVDRNSQRDALHGNKRWREGERKLPARGPGRTLHAPISGRLDVSESQQYLLGDELPQDVHNYDVEMDANGNARVLDEEGWQADLVTYRPFYHDEQGNIVYRDDVKEEPVEDHKDLGIHPLFGRRSKTQTEHMGRPLPHQISGTGDFAMLPAGPVGEMAEPIPIGQGTRFDGNTGIVTPHGMYFPKGIDFTNVVRRSDSLFSLGEVLIKALGDPGEIGWWDKRLNQSGKGPGHGRDVFNWVEANKDKTDQFDTDFNVNYPLEGIDDYFPDFRTLIQGGNMKQQAERTIGSPLGDNSKMPGAHQNFPTHMCGVGSKMREVAGATCENCYAHDHGRASMNQKQIANWRNAIALRTPENIEDMVRYGSALGNRMSSSVLDHGTDLFRFFESGDLQGKTSEDKAKHLSLLSDTMRTIGAKSPLKSRAWLPTREAQALNMFLQSSGRDYDTAIPDNLSVSLSAPFVGQGADNDRNQELGLPKLSSAFQQATEHPNVTASFVGAEDTPGTHICPVSIAGGSCMDHNCEACWGDKPVSYNPHIAGSKNQQVRLKTGGNIDYDKNMKPLFPINLDQQRLNDIL